MSSKNVEVIFVINKSSLNIGRGLDIHLQPHAQFCIVVRNAFDFSLHIISIYCIYCTDFCILYLHINV